MRWSSRSSSTTSSRTSPATASSIDCVRQGGTAMNRTAVFTPDAPRAIGPYSQAIAAGGLVFCSGQIPLAPPPNEMVGAALAPAGGLLSAWAQPPLAPRPNERVGAAFALDGGRVEGGAGAVAGVELEQPP